MMSGVKSCLICDGMLMITASSSQRTTMASSSNMPMALAAHLNVSCSSTSTVLRSSKDIAALRSRRKSLNPYCSASVPCTWYIRPTILNAGCIYESEKLFVDVLLHYFMIIVNVEM